MYLLNVVKKFKSIIFLNTNPFTLKKKNKKSSFENLFIMIKTTLHLLSNNNKFLLLIKVIKIH